MLHNADERRECTNPIYHPAFYHARALYPNVSIKKLVLWDDFWFRHLTHEAYGGPRFLDGVTVLPPPPLDCLPSMESVVSVHAAALREKLAGIDAQTEQLRAETVRLKLALREASHGGVAAPAAQVAAAAAEAGDACASASASASALASLPVPASALESTSASASVDQVALEPGTGACEASVVAPRLPADSAAIAAVDEQGGAADVSADVIASADAPAAAASVALDAQ